MEPPEPPDPPELLPEDEELELVLVDAGGASSPQPGTPSKTSIANTKSPGRHLLRIETFLHG